MAFYKIALSDYLDKFGKGNTEENFFKFTCNKNKEVENQDKIIVEGECDKLCQISQKQNVIDVKIICQKQNILKWRTV